MNTIALYGSEQEPVKAFGVGPAYDQFLMSMGDLMPIVWDLNAMMLDIWDSTRQMYSWVMPDNFHVHNKVRGIENHKLTFMGNHYQVDRKVAMPKAKGRSLCANMTHSLDSLGVREITMRCGMSQEMKDNAAECAVYHGRDEAMPTNEVGSDNDRMVATLWENYRMSGFLSVRVLHYIDSMSVKFMGRAELLELLGSLPKKTFRVMSIHQWWI